MFWPFPQLPHGGSLSLSSSSTTDQLQCVQQYRPLPGFVPTFISTPTVFGATGPGARDHSARARLAGQREPNHLISMVHQLPATCQYVGHSSGRHPICWVTLAIAPRALHALLHEVGPHSTPDAEPRLRACTATARRLVNTLVSANTRWACAGALPPFDAWLPGTGGSRMHRLLGAFPLNEKSLSHARILHNLTYTTRAPPARVHSRRCVGVTVWP